MKRCLTMMSIMICRLGNNVEDNQMSGGSVDLIE